MLCCHGICGTAKSRDIDKAWGSRITFEEVDESPLQVPQVAGLLTYSGSLDQTLRGTPLREGRAWYLTAERTELVGLSLYANGFSFTHCGGEVAVSLTPFSIVRSCKIQGNSASGQQLEHLKIFKVSLFMHSMTYFFGISGETTGPQAATTTVEDAESKADAERAQWVLDIALVTRQVTQSLFPPFRISCTPLPKVPATHTRLMAGYLLHNEADGAIAAMYCELHSHGLHGRAKLALYETELCHVPVLDIPILQDSSCCERIGVDCGCFCIDDHQFAARTFLERRIWLRAISNVKVKLRNEAPPPSTEDLGHYREAIKEYLAEFASTLEASQVAMDALLQRCPLRRGVGSTICASAPIIGIGMGAGMEFGPDNAANRTGESGAGGGYVVVSGLGAAGGAGSASGDTHASRGERCDREAAPPDSIYLSSPHAGDSAGGPAGWPSVRNTSGQAAAVTLDAVVLDSAVSCCAAQADAGAGVSSCAASAAATPWGAGAVRVLLAVMPPSGSSAQAERKRCLDDALRIEQWCSSCGIMDVTFLVPASGSGPGAAVTTLRELRIALRALGARCKPGDVCMLHLAGLDDLCNARQPALAPGGAAEDDAETAFLAAGRLLGFLPPRVTVICISDSRRCLAPGDEVSAAPAEAGCASSVSDCSPRTISFVLSAPEGVGDAVVAASPPGFCTAAMLKAGEALSLVDGPCSLTCADFFAEMAEQAHDLAAARGAQAPSHEISCFPQSARPVAVAWPIVAAPRNQTRADDGAGGGEPRRLQVLPVHVETVSTPPLAASPRPLLVTSPLPSALAYTTTFVASASSPPASLTRSSPPSASGDSDVSSRRTSNSARRLPKDLGGLSAMLTGGFGGPARNPARQPPGNTLA